MSRGRRILLVAAVVVVAAVAVLVARGIRSTVGWHDFETTYPGVSALPAGTPVGFPAWLSWQHFLTSFLLLFIVTSGWRIRSKTRPPAFVTRDATRFPRTKGRPKRLGLPTWWHLVVDTLWIVNGVVFIVLLIATGQWARIVPVSFDIVPNAITAGVQYASLDWPMHDGWVHYNSLQLLSYFATTFLAAPLAIVTGLRLSPVWPAVWARPTGVLGDRAARGIHSIVFWYFVVFTIVHVGLVLATGALANLNHMYAGRDDATWIGFVVWVASLVVTAAAYLLLRTPVQKRIAAWRSTVR